MLFQLVLLVWGWVVLLSLLLGVILILRDTVGCYLLQLVLLVWGLGGAALLIVFRGRSWPRPD